MNSVILQLALRYVRFLLLAFAIVTLLRGHNHPGGGFIGGLMAGLSVVMKGFAYDMDQLKEQMQFSSQGFIGTGLGLILLSTIPSLLAGKDFMTGLWISVPLPLNGTLKLGTPLLFDIGVFFAVIGVILVFLFSLKKGA